MTYFTYESIIMLLSYLDKKYSLYPLNKFHGQAGIILRHDVDLDIDPAYRLSQLELEQEIRGSFFVMVSAPTYNCNSPANRRMLLQMAQDGIEVALHFDPAVYGDIDDEDLGHRAREEAAVLENIIGQKVTSISLHNPGVKNHFPLFPDFNNAYDPEIFNEDIYLSDSRMHFRSDPGVFFENAKSTTHQLLLHPMHYSEVEPIYPAAKLAYFRRVVETVHDNFKANSNYDRLVGDQLVERLQEDMKNWKQ